MGIELKVLRSSVNFIQNLGDIVGPYKITLICCIGLVVLLHRVCDLNFFYQWCHFLTSAQDETLNKG